MVPLTSKNGSSTTRTSPPTWAVTEKPIVTYAEDTSIWSSLAGEFNSRLPLRHLSWQGSLRSNRSSSPTTAPFKASTLMSNPIRMTFFQNMHQVVCTRIQCFYIYILLVVRMWITTKITSGIFNIGSTASVFDKIRSDFSLKRDRCMELKLSNSESRMPRKPYRNMIIQNQITIFDFREYLFSRQCRLILLLQSAADVCHRTKVFAVSFAGTLREYEVSLVPNFRESWLYSLCMRIVCECDVVSTSPLVQSILFKFMKHCVQSSSKFPGYRPSPNHNSRARSRVLLNRLFLGNCMNASPYYHSKDLMRVADRVLR
ncbi:hypothetical protein BASA62_002304 [Batrachochytrium salamandrivorans]|nr:hypothetical protein BASA62_002304 [Batrachochytrium salamandrivorans]